MNKEVVIIGGGISGLFASCICAKRGFNTTVLSYGQGALAVAGGIIDVLGYDAHGKLVEDPLASIAKLPQTHPYSKIGTANIEAALKAFVALAKDAHYPYKGDAHHNQMVPTGIGSFKPTCLTPPSIAGDLIPQAERLVVLGFRGLKDYFADLVCENLRRNLPKNSCEILSAEITLNFDCEGDCRDLSALDIARKLDTHVGYLNFREQLKNYVKGKTVFILPPVLSATPTTDLLDLLDIEINAKFIEVSAIPPSVTGYRTELMLKNMATKFGVEIIEKAHVIGAFVHDGHCTSVMTQGCDRLRTYEADHFILASGGVFGNGLVTAMGRMYEPIFNIEIEVPKNQQQWSHQYLFTGKPQPFATYGIETDDKLRPLQHGQVLLDNVHVVGRALSGYDFCFEKSGNGVAICSAYHAASILE